MGFEPKSASAWCTFLHALRRRQPVSALVESDLHYQAQRALGYVHNSGLAVLGKSQLEQGLNRMRPGQEHDLVAICLTEEDLAAFVLREVHAIQPANASYHLSLFLCHAASELVSHRTTRRRLGGRSRSS